MDMMDTELPTRDWSWVAAAMPRVKKQIAIQRSLFGDEYVDECLRRSLAGEPGWFFAREGPIALGTPWDTDVLKNFAALTAASREVLVVLKEPQHVVK
nr:hypothetical protein [uncultured Roseateles sp.]